MLSLVAHGADDKAGCGTSDEPWVSVVFEDSVWGNGLSEAILLDLRAGLAEHHIEACGSAQNAPLRPATAAVKLSARGSEAVHVTVYVHDAVTNKELSRDVDLSRVPLDGRAFAVALAADELLWASWAEIALHRPRHEITAPKRLVTEVEHSIKPSRDALTLVGLQWGVEHYQRGQTQFGPDAAFDLHFTPRLGLRLTAGYRQATQVTAADGQVQTVSVRAATDLTSALLRSRALQLAWTIGTESIWCRFRGETSGESLARDFTGLALYARTGLLFTLRIHDPVWLQLGVGAGYALRGVEATDAGRVITGVSGFQQSVLTAVMGEL
jgi:hypothetical protein